MNRILLTLIVTVLSFSTLQAQRRYVGKGDGFSFGIGGGLGSGTSKLSSKEVFISTGFESGIEFGLSGGGVSVSEHATGYLSPGIEIYATTDISPFFDLNYLKCFNSDDFIENSVSGVAGISVKVLNTKRFLIVPEIGIGTALSIGTITRPGKVILFGCTLGVKPSPDKIVLVNAGISQNKSNWTWSFGIGSLIY